MSPESLPLLSRYLCQVATSAESLPLTSRCHSQERKTTHRAKPPASNHYDEHFRSWICYASRKPSHIGDRCTQSLCKVVAHICRTHFVARTKEIVAYIRRIFRRTHVGSRRTFRRTHFVVAYFVVERT